MLSIKITSKFFNKASLTPMVVIFFRQLTKHLMKVSQLMKNKNYQQNFHFSSWLSHDSCPAQFTTIFNSARVLSESLIFYCLIFYTILTLMAFFRVALYGCKNVKLLVQIQLIYGIIRPNRIQCKQTICRSWLASS